MKIPFAALAASLALAGCHSQPTAGGLSADEERQLDNAAAMLDEHNIFDSAPDGLAGNETVVPAPEAGAGAAAAAANRTGNAQ